MACFTCVASLERAFKCIAAVERAQSTLNKIILQPQLVKEEHFSDDENIVYEGPADYDDIIENIKIESIKTDSTSEKSVENNVEKPSEEMEKRRLCISVDQLPLSQVHMTWKDYEWLCRLCETRFPTFEELHTHSVQHHKNDSERHDEIIVKLAFVNAVYVNVNSNDMLPKTVCFICYDNLNKAYEFLDNVKRAQDVLSKMFTSADENKCDLSDDDRMPGFDDFLCNDDSAAVKLEDEARNKYSETSELEISLHVKREMKEEPDIDDQTYDDSLNVQDILDAAICNASFNSNVTIYAKEVSDLSKKVVRSWKDYPWVCGYCNIEFLNIDMLRSHCKVVHGKCSAFMCIDCKAGRNEDFTSFVKHVRKHRKTLRNHCYYCDLALDKTENLTTHIKEHFFKSQLPCPLCGEILKNEDSLKLHLRDFNITKQKRRPRRKPGTPITIEDLTCKLCKKVYKNPNSLRDHMKLHTIDRKRNYTCDRCGKMFYNKGTGSSRY
ncbi:hypothetical protein B5X24_HaOG202621 [Helicoverpa armigera]|uniref:Uncharacterized protein n=1 Tax=Helicoverpa armigera TaxID=29058 RepID=A0A2W1BZF3_HELAM|nr:hypothetical protein B5X24_HaOG202621 [Helicoverpa armigera]